MHLVRQKDISFCRIICYTERKTENKIIATSTNITTATTTSTATAAATATWCTPPPAYKPVSQR